VRGYGSSPPKTVIAAGFLRADLETVFESCELTDHFIIPFGIENSAIVNHTDIFVCRHPREPWHVFWKRTHGSGRAWRTSLAETRFLRYRSRSRAEYRCRSVAGLSSAPINMFILSLKPPDAPQVPGRADCDAALTGTSSLPWSSQ
jgi:hypothetical protein